MCGKPAEIQETPDSPRVQPDYQEKIAAIWPEWKITKQLGKGSYGVVYEAVRTDNHVQSHAAIKVISIPCDSGEIESLQSEGLDLNSTRSYFRGIVDDFVGEIQLMESLKGVQNIVGVEDYKVVEKPDTIGWDIYIRMELLTPFTALTKEKTLTEEEVIRLGCDICSALEVCSQKEVIHRDIKPENIFIHELGHYKLGDFGIARKLENTSGGLSQKGTFNYMAPEVANSTNYDHRVDIYSLGIVLYRFLNNNTLPFLTPENRLNPGDRKAAVDRRLRGEALPMPVGASSALANVVLKACAFDPNHRFATATQMKQALMAVANGTYANDDSVLDRTASVRKSQKDLNSTTAVRSAGNSAAVGSFGQSSKDEKKGKKAKKAKIIFIGILAGILVLAGLLAYGFFSSAAYETYRDFKDDSYSAAIAGYHNDVKEKFIQELILNNLLDGKVEEVANEYKNGKLSYDETVSKLEALKEMDFENADKKLTEIMTNRADQIVADYQSGKLSYEDAVKQLEVLKAKGLEIAQEKIEEITISFEADTTLDKANGYYNQKDWKNAILEYKKIPANNEHYTEAQNKLAEICPKYINEVITIANQYNAQKQYKEAMAHISSAYDVLPEGTDTSALDKAKSESLGHYQNDVTAQVNTLKAQGDYVGAFKVIDEAIGFDNNQYFQTLKANTEKDYVSSITTTVNNYLKQEDYVSAKRVSENALTVLPGNADLIALDQSVAAQTPTYLLDVCPPYETAEYAGYINGERITMAGNTYTNAFTLTDDAYALFNVGSQYTSLKFLVGHCDGTKMYESTIKVYCDGILKTELKINAEDLPKNVSVDITGVKQIKIESSCYWGKYGFANVTVK